MATVLGKISVNYSDSSANQWHATGQNAYGCALREGEGIRPNPFEAAKYFKLSADQGYGLAQKP
jgi:TPR repeat protein